MDGIAHGRRNAVGSEIEWRVNFFVFRLAQQYHGAHHRSKENEFLAQRVEAAVIEVHGGNRVGNVTLGDDDRVDDVAIGAGVMTEARQAAQSP